MRRGLESFTIRGIGLVLLKTGKSGGTADSRCNIPTYTDHQATPRTLLSCSLSSIFSNTPDFPGDYIAIIHTSFIAVYISLICGGSEDVNGKNKRQNWW
jgi:hypothetical protein